MLLRFAALFFFFARFFDCRSFLCGKLVLDADLLFLIRFESVVKILVIAALRNFHTVIYGKFAFYYR